MHHPTDNGAYSPIRRQNRSRILSEIRRVPGISRRQLALTTNLTDASVSRIVKDLIGEGVVQDAESEPGRLRRGRPQIGLRIKPEGLSVLAICLSAYEQRVSVIDAAGERLFETDVPDVSENDPAEITRFIVSELSSRRFAGPAAVTRLGGAAISVAGAIDSRNAEIVSAPLINWGNDCFGKRIADALHCPVVLDNVANVLHIAELRFGGRGPAANSLLIHGASGLGASLIVNGSLSRGAGDEGAINRMLVDPGLDGAGPNTRLGELVGGEAILRQLERVCPGRIPAAGRATFRARLLQAISEADSGNSAVAAIFAQAGRHLGLAFGAIAAVVQPERLILAGPLAKAGTFARGIEETFRGSFGSGDGPTVQIAEISYHRATELVGLETYLFRVPDSSVSAVVAPPGRTV